jgi:hypothetical protein
MAQGLQVVVAVLPACPPGYDVVHVGRQYQFISADMLAKWISAQRMTRQYLHSQLLPCRIIPAIVCIRSVLLMPRLVLLAPSPAINQRRAARRLARFLRSRRHCLQLSLMRRSVVASP